MKTIIVFCLALISANGVWSQTSEEMRAVEVMPMFPGCESVENLEERKKCADRRMLEFLYSNLKYPEVARTNNIEGTVIVNFVVEKDGSISNEQVIRSVSAEIDEAALDAVREMRNQNILWHPGLQSGKPVRVTFNMPLRFKLEDNNSKSKKKKN